MVYFIANTRSGDIKIGFSNDPGRRLELFRTGSSDPLRLVGVIPGGRWEETALHRRFAQFRTGGEWFRNDPALTAAVAELIAASPRQNVWTECLLRRRCRNGLNDLAVIRTDTGAVVEILESCWGKDRRLVLTLTGNELVDAELCELADEWPVTCCKPRRAAS